MQATRILPDLQASLLCEEVRQEANGNFFIIGVVNFLRVPQLPIVAGRLCVFNRWTAGIGQFTENVRLIAPDQTTALRKGEMKFELREPGSHSTNVMVFTQVEFKIAGIYFVEVLVDDVMKLRYPVPLVHAPPPNQNPQPRRREKRPDLKLSPIYRSATVSVAAGRMREVLQIFQASLANLDCCGWRQPRSVFIAAVPC